MFQPEDPRFQPGDKGEYASSTHDKWLAAGVKRSNPDGDPWYRPACRQDGHGTGLRALLSKDGESWDHGR